jgi:hypothetical protein
VTAKGRLGSLDHPHVGLFVFGALVGAGMFLSVIAVLL